MMHSSAVFGQTIDFAFRKSSVFRFRQILFYLHAVTEVELALAHGNDVRDIPWPYPLLRNWLLQDEQTGSPSSFASGFQLRNRQ